MLVTKMESLVGCLPWKTNGGSGTLLYILASTLKAWFTKEVLSVLGIYNFQCVQLAWLNEVFLDQTTNWLQVVPGQHSYNY